MQKRFGFVFAIVAVLLALAGSVRVNAQGPTSGPVTVGKPWRGAPGVTQTVAQVMQRNKNAPVGATRSLRVTPRRVRSRNVPPAPGSAAAQLSRPPVPNGATRVLAPNNPQTVGTNFLAAQLSESGYIPPDSMGAVGPTQVLVVVNGRIKVFDKAGNLGTLNSDLSVFFGALAPANFTSPAYDPRVRYDRLSGRWFISALDNAATSNRILIAVSSGSTISSASSFTFFSFRQDAPNCSSCSDSGLIADYDSLGVDANSLYIGVDMYTSFGGFSNTTGFVVNKSDLLNNILTVTAFRQLIDGSAGPLSPRGVDNDNPNATEGFFIGTDANFFSLLTLRRITYSGSTPSISGNITLFVPSTYIPLDVPALGSPPSIDAIDDRLYDAQIKKNKLTGAVTLWTAHAIQVDSTGGACGGSTPCTDGGRDAARWYEIGNLSGSPTLVQSGTLYDSAASNSRFFWVPSVAASGQGHMALGASTAVANTSYAGIAAAGRLSSDPSGATQAFTSVIAGTDIYTLTAGGDPRVRWGDYSQTVVDPMDDQTMWTFQEYANAYNSWGVRAVQLIAPLPATPTSASPPSVARGYPVLAVTITGTSIAGSGFFDPGSDAGGPGYANHIRASVTGGVVVLGVTFNNPTQITLSISTCNAANGNHDVTVTNPDGQSMTGVNILTVSGAPGICYSYIFPLIFR